MMVNQGIPLSEAHEHFFDRKLWSLLCAQHGQDVAIRLVNMRPMFYDPSSRELGRKIYKDLLDHLASGEIIATGIPASSTLRESIPPGLWRHLNADILRNQALSLDHRFYDVQLTDRPPIAAEDPRGPYIQWLIDRRNKKGDEFKKTLLKAALKEINPFNERQFNAAYADVYRRKCGRPRKSDKTKK